MSFYKQISSGGAEAGTVCNNPYSSYGYEGGMYDTPITGSGGEKIYEPTGDKAFGAGSPINSNSTSRFQNQVFYKTDHQQVVDLGDPPAPKGVFTSIPLLNATTFQEHVVQAEDRTEAIAQAHVYASQLAFKATRTWRGYQAGSFYVDFDEDDIFVDPKPLIYPRGDSNTQNDQVTNTYRFIMRVRQCGCFDETADGINTESSVIEGGELEALQDSHTSAIAASITTDQIGLGGSTSYLPIHGIVMGYAYNVTVVKKTIPSSESDFDSAGTNDAPKACVTGTYTITLPCPRIKVNKTQGGEQGKAKGFGKPNRRETAHMKRQRQKQQQQNRKITDLSVVPEDQVRYMTIF